jgi:Rod binding domain-containing protein
MDAANLILNSVVSLAGSPENIRKPDDASDAQKIKFAKDFEAIFIGKLLDEMKKTVVNWDDERDSASKQMDGIFWMHLADELGGKGGLGLWNDIYKSLNTTENENTEAVSLDESL